MQSNLIFQQATAKAEHSATVRHYAFFIQNQIGLFTFFLVKIKNNPFRIFMILKGFVYFLSTAIQAICYLKCLFAAYFTLNIAFCSTLNVRRQISYTFSNHLPNILSNQLVSIDSDVISYKYLPLSILFPS